MSAIRISPIRALLSVAALLTIALPLPGARAERGLAPRSADPLWYRTRGGPSLDNAWAVDTDAAGNIYLATFQTLPGKSTHLVAYKLTPDGAEVWRAQWGGTAPERMYVLTVAEPYVYIGGSTQTDLSHASADMAVIALRTADGSKAWDFVWQRTTGYDEVDGLVADGNAIYVSGWTATGTAQNDLALLKLDLGGHKVWERIWGSAGWDQADGQMVVDADTVHIAGRYNAPNALLGGYALLAKFSKADGHYVAHTIWGPGWPLGYDDAYGLASDGAWLYAVGLTTTHGDGGQIFLLKYDKALNLQWERTWGGAAGESARAIEVDTDGSIVIAANTFSYGSGGNDIALLRYSPSGDLLGSRVWGGPKNDFAHGLALRDGYAHIAGQTASRGAGAEDAVLVKADAGAPRFPAMERVWLAVGWRE